MRRSARRDGLSEATQRTSLSIDQSEDSLAPWTAVPHSSAAYRLAAPRQLKARHARRFEAVLALVEGDGCREGVLEGAEELKVMDGLLLRAAGL